VTPIDGVVAARPERAAVSNLAAGLLLIGRTEGMPEPAKIERRVDLAYTFEVEPKADGEATDGGSATG
jgi:hypothetical protein